ncbi:MAG: protein kinase [Deltaproteobacteria bacterium]|nr:protein kinase [Deltaproteobacteria bacterium]
MKPELDDTLAAPSPASPDPTATSRGNAPMPVGHGLAVGQQLGHFRIERKLGAGGMGEVYLATDLALDRPVAVKVLPEALAKDPKRRERMIREARAQARVSHPNVGHMYFIGEEDGRVFFAMEYVNGKTLGDAIAEGPMSVDDALSVIRAAALGLREAHREGFTHRDVKPSNLMLDGHGMVKVLDFGLAAGEAGVLSDGPVAQTSLAGTPLYMAPEQARGEGVDLRADIYALGATLFHLICGKPPFQADSVDELLSMHATSVRPSVPRRGIPRTQFGAIDGLIARMMAAKPDDRFASYDELLRAIELASSAQTRPGGFGVRTIAMGIDFVLLLVTAGGLSMLVESLSGQRVKGDIVMQTAIIAYFALTTARWGRTLGKSIFELEVVDVITTQRPTLARCVRRAVIMFGVPWLAAALNFILGTLGIATSERLFGVLMGLVAAGGALMLLYAANRISGKRALWDRLSGTMVRYRTTRTAAK